ncbi:TPA: phage replisome organizer N-terminal domain-containing protein [Enterococcus faecalis]
MAEISWIKLSTSLPDNKKIKRIRKLPDGDRVILFWVFLLARAGESNQKGGLFLTDTLPYSDEDLAADFDFTVEFVKFAILTLEKYSMVTTYEDVIFIKNWEEYQAIDGMEKVKEQNRIRQAKYREKQKQLSLSNVTSNVTRNADVTLSNGTDKDIDKEIDIDKDNKEEPKKPPCKYSDEHLRLAEKLKNNLINDFPSEMKKVKIEKWADVFRLIEKQDKQTIAAIDYVLDWLPTNSFWFGNIRSASKFRAQFEKLKFEIKQEKERAKQPKTHYRQQPIRQESKPEWLDKPREDEKVSAEKQAELDRQIKEYMEGK